MRPFASWWDWNRLWRIKRVGCRVSDGDGNRVACVPRLVMRGLRKQFGATQALGGVDLSIRPGEVMALVGENGAGKSTLMKILAGAVQPDGGAMALDGQPYTPENPLHGRSSGVGMIYQELALAPHLSVMENILLGIEPVRGPWLNWRAMRGRATEALQSVGMVDVDPAALVRTLSLAQQQLVEIARAVAMDCRVLVLDEPTSSLTQPDIRTLFTLIRQLKARGIAVVYISHVLEDVQQIADRFTVLRDGASVGVGDARTTPVAEIVAMMVGRDVTNLYPRSPRTPGDVVLAIRGLSGRQKPVHASLDLRRGEVLGIAGLIGAGRTELMRAVFGLDAVVSGDVRVGAFGDGASPAERWAQGVGMVSEDRKGEGLATELGIAENLTLPKLDGLGPWRFVRPSRQRQACALWIEQLAIRCQGPRQRVGTLSGGNQQKVAIARLLHADVDVLLLDEPTRGIDVGSKVQIYQFINDLAVRGKAILMISSYLPELLGVCDRIAVMCRGQLSPARASGDWSEHQLMSVAMGQEAA